MLAPQATGAPVPTLFVVAMLLAVIGHVTTVERVKRWIDTASLQPAFIQAAIVSACLVLFTVLSSTDAPFIYFQF